MNTVRVQNNFNANNNAGVYSQPYSCVNIKRLKEL
jgi:hypothetical protein